MKWRAVLSPSRSQWDLEAQNQRTAIREVIRVSTVQDAYAVAVVHDTGTHAVGRACMTLIIAFSRLCSAGI